MCKCLHYLYSVCLFLVTSIYLLTACSDSSEAEKEIYFGNLQLKICNTNGETLENVEVRLHTFTIKTNHSGEVAFDNIPIGSYTMKCSLQGYNTENKKVEIERDQTAHIELVMNQEPMQFSMSEHERQLTSIGGKVNLEIRSNVSWIAEGTVSWLEIQATSSPTGGNIYIQCAANDTDDIRTGKIMITAGNTVYEWSVTQTSPLRLLEVKATVGNMLNNEASSVLLTYNQPVELNGQISEPHTAITDFHVQSLSNGKQLRFNYGTGAMGGDYIFTVPVKAANREIHSTPFTAGFYKEKWEYNGQLAHVDLAEDESSCFITTYTPNRFVHISLKDGSIINSLDLPASPGSFCYNPYNGYYYVTQTFQLTSTYSNKVWIIDPKRMQIVDELAFEPDDFDHPQFPPINPVEIRFTNSGFGIVQCCSKASSGTKWLYIDSDADNKLSRYVDERYPQWDDYPYFQDIYVNHDRSKIIGCASDGNNELFLMDTKNRKPKLYTINNKFHSDEYYAGGRLMIKRFHRNESKVYLAAAPCSQCIVDINKDTYSPVGFAESRSAFADFDYSYKKGYRVWQLTDIDNSFYIIDMDKPELKFVANTIWYEYFSCMRGVFCLKDNKRMMIPYMDGNQLKTSLIIFDIDDFNTRLK